MELYQTQPRRLPPVTAEVPFDASVTLYLRASGPAAARDRQADARARVEALAEAGILLDWSVSEWPSKAVVQRDGPADTAIEIYDEFTTAVATRSDTDLAPSFEDRPGVGWTDRIVVLPVICLAVRGQNELTGLYPCWIEGRHDAVDDGLRALESGEAVENLA